MSSLPIDAECTVADYEARIGRLERRIARERTARAEAEMLAERGMRDLFLANRDLDRRISERTHELDAARRQAEESARARVYFLASLSRKVRTPLNGVIGSLELLDGRVVNEQERIWLDSATESADDLLRLFSRLLLFVGLDEPLLYAESADEPVTATIEALVAGIEERWSRRALAAGKLLMVDDSTPAGFSVEVPFDLLAQLVDEAIDNAVRHAVPGPVRVTIDEEDGRPVIEVADAGPGIHGVVDSEDTSDLRLTLGMGFPLMYRLAGRLGASISQSRNDQRGTTVRVELP